MQELLFRGRTLIYFYHRRMISTIMEDKPLASNPLQTCSHQYYHGKHCRERRNSVIFTVSYDKMVESTQLSCSSVSPKCNISMIIPLVQKAPKTSVLNVCFRMASKRFVNHPVHSPEYFSSSLYLVSYWRYGTHFQFMYFVFWCSQMTVKMIPKLLYHDALCTERNIGFFPHSIRWWGSIFFSTSSTARLEAATLNDPHNYLQ